MESFIKEQSEAENQPKNFKEKLGSFFQNKKKVLFLSLGIISFGAITLFAVLSSFLDQTKKIAVPETTLAPKPISREIEETPQDLIPPEEDFQKPETIAAKPAPEVFFDDYKLETDWPQAPDQITLYTFKTNYSDQEIKDFAAKFGLFNIQSSLNDFVIAKNLNNPKNYGHLLFNKTTGGFVFESFGVHKPDLSASTNPSNIARAFLEEKGLIDQTIIVHATYQVKGLENVTFVEFHRDWNKTGLPIFNIVGLLNLDETVKLADLKLGAIDQKTPDNELIINTSDNYDGKERPNDFGSITVAVLDDGTIFSVESNLRQIEKSQTITETLLTPQQAFEKIKKDNGLFQLTIPLGQGVVDFNHVYPQNLAQAKLATVTDFMIAYLEKPPAIQQRFLQPVYFFKGKALLSSGYQVNWVQAIPAIASTAKILGDTIKFGSFTPTPTPTPTSTPTPIPSPTLSPSRTSCNPNENQLNNVIELAGLGKVGTFVGHYGNQYYFVPPLDQSLPNLESVLEEFKKLGVSARIRATHKIRSRDWNKDPNCPKRLTGSTPAIFVYAPEGTKLSIKSGANLTYSNPAHNPKNGWEIVARPNGVLFPITNYQSPITNFSYLYYEYEPISFNQPQAGWIIKKSELENLARKTIASQLDLTSLEEDRLVFELNHASFDIKSDVIFLGAIATENVTQKLPLEVAPKPDAIHRYHFYLTSASEKDLINPPSPSYLSPISRSDFMILELGAVSP